MLNYGDICKNRYLGKDDFFNVVSNKKLRNVNFLEMLKQFFQSDVKKVLFLEMLHCADIGKNDFFLREKRLLQCDLKEKLRNLYFRRYA